MKLLNTIKTAWSSQDIRRRILVTILIIIAFRILAQVPVPGVNPNVIKNFYNSSAGGILQFLNTFTGGTLNSFSILSVGLLPFINASVIFQLLPTIIKRLEQMQKEGEQGRKRLTQYTRLLTVPLGILTSITIFITLKTQGIIGTEDPLQIVSIVSVLTAGSLFMMWMGEVLTEKGIGNGISLLIMVGIVATIPAKFLQRVVTYSGFTPFFQIAGALVFAILIALLYIYILKLAKDFKKIYFKIPAILLSFALIVGTVVFLIIPTEITQKISNTNIQKFGQSVLDLKNAEPIQLGLIMGFAIVVIGLIVLFNEAAKNLPIYFSRKASTAAAVAKKSFMPLKLLQAGVMPIIFANALLIFPYTIALILLHFDIKTEWIKSACTAVQSFIENADWRYWTLNFLFTVFFSYFYTFVLFRPSQVADNLKKSGSYIPGIRPGIETEKFLTKTMLHLVFAGAVVLGLMSTSQIFVGGALGRFVGNNNNNLFSTIFTSGTSLLITVGVVLDTRRQFRSYIAQRNYDALIDDLDEFGDHSTTGELNKDGKIAKKKGFIKFFRKTTFKNDSKSLETKENLIIEDNKFLDKSDSKEVIDIDVTQSKTSGKSKNKSK